MGHRQQLACVLFVAALLAALAPASRIELRDVQLAARAPPRVDDGGEGVLVALGITLESALRTHAVATSGRDMRVPLSLLADVPLFGVQPAPLRIAVAGVDDHTALHLHGAGLLQRIADVSAWERVEPGVEPAVVCTAEHLLDWSTGVAALDGFMYATLRSALDGDAGVHMLVPLSAAGTEAAAPPVLLSLPVDVATDAEATHELFTHVTMQLDGSRMVVHVVCRGSSPTPAPTVQRVLPLTFPGAAVNGLMLDPREDLQGAATIDEAGGTVLGDAEVTDGEGAMCRLLASWTMSRPNQSPAPASFEDALEEMLALLPFSSGSVRAGSQSTEPQSLSTVAWLTQCATRMTTDEQSPAIVARVHLAVLHAFAASALSRLVDVHGMHRVPEPLRKLWLPSASAWHLQHDALLEQFMHDLEVAGTLSQLPDIERHRARSGALLSTCATSSPESAACSFTSVAHFIMASHALQSALLSVQHLPQRAAITSFAALLTAHALDAIDVISARLGAAAPAPLRTALHVGLHAATLAVEKAPSVDTAHCVLLAGFLGKGALHGELSALNSSANLDTDVCTFDDALWCDIAEAWCLTACLHYALQSINVSATHAVLPWTPALQRLRRLQQSPQVASALEVLERTQERLCLDARYLQALPELAKGATGERTLADVIQAEEARQLAPPSCESCAGEESRRELLTPDDLCSQAGLAHYNATLINTSDPSYHAARWMWFEKVHDDSSVVLIHNFLSPEEADHIILYACGKLARSTVATASGSEVHRVRTSSTLFFKMSETDVLRRIEDRATTVVGYPRSHLEALQIVRYQPGQQYEPHFDWFDEGTASYQMEMLRWGGQRAITLFVYLTDAPSWDSSGGTIFPHLGNLTARPPKGTAVMWHDTHPNGTVDARTFHGGTPPVNSTKYGLNVWIRQYPVHIDAYEAGFLKVPNAPTAPPPPDVPAPNADVIEIAGVWEQGQEEFVDVPM